MKYFFLFCFLFTSSLQLIGQSYFPDNCAGIWEGEMLIYHQGNQVNQVDVRMEIERIPDSLKWSWKTEYLAPEPIVKNYMLILEDPGSNKYTLDENNGILLYSYVFENRMFSNFEVEGNLLTSVYILENNQLIFEISSGKDIGKTENDITNFSVMNLQRTVLKRKME
jgi:hypothetical protein